MLTFWGAPQRHCDGVSRRNFLQVGALGAGLTLADQLRLRAATAAAGRASGRAKSVVMIYLPGGPSHIDTYDPKPDAPAEFRGEFKPIHTNVPGVQLSEHLPRHASMMDKLAVLRSITTVDEHSDSMVMTGYGEGANRNVGHPSFGSVVSRVRGDAGGIPPFVSLRGMSIGCEPGYLGLAHRAFTSEGPGVQNLRPAQGVSLSRLGDRQSLLASVDGLRRDLDASGTMAGLDAFTARAFDMIASGETRKALDLSREEPRARDAYKGIEHFLLARRLVEAGVGCVTLAYGGWDTHERNFIQLRQLLPNLDRGVAQLVTDLDERGLLDDVIVVVWGEFGRTPKINNNQGGRDHWAPVMSALVAGGGLKMGQAIGASTPRGEVPKESPYRPSNVLATIYRAIGIDPAMTFPNGQGRPMYVLDERESVAELV
jgi:uncharacterized protein (DUF1501 family)